MRMETAVNVYGEPLASCSEDPITGFFRDGCCNTTAGDTGSHTICAVVTAAFLAYSKAQGNDLMTPNPAHQFPGLQPGDSWCLCAKRWLQAHEAGCAPKVRIRSTHRKALEVVPLEVLETYAVSEH